jgi:hypothetical protein
MAMTTASRLRHFALVAILDALPFPAVSPAQTRSRVVQMEGQLLIQHSVDPRVFLIREYFRLSKQDPSAERASVTHLLWLIDHHPDLSFLSEPTATEGERLERTRGASKGGHRSVID